MGKRTYTLEATLPVPRRYIGRFQNEVLGIENFTSVMEVNENEEVVLIGQFKKGCKYKAAHELCNICKKYNVYLNLPQPIRNDFSTLRYVKKQKRVKYGSKRAKKSIFNQILAFFRR